VKRTAIIAGLVILIALMSATVSMAATPFQTTLSLNSGYSYTLGELELEFKSNSWASGVAVGYGWTNLEISAFGRYYIPLNPVSSDVNWNLFLTATPSLLIRPAQSPGIGFGIKVGPGIDLRWRHLRLAVEGGYRWSTIYGHGGYAKVGIGYIF